MGARCAAAWGSRKAVVARLVRMAPPGTGGWDGGGDCGGVPGGTYTHRDRPVPPKQVAAAPVRERILLVAVGSHLERSQMVLAEIANTGATGKGKVDISYEQQAAQDLVDSNRLYRQAATRNGDTATAAMLEELERVLLEISHSPSDVSTAELDDLRRQIEDRGILFKVRVFATRVRDRERQATVQN